MGTIKAVGDTAGEHNLEQLRSLPEIASRDYLGARVRSRQTGNSSNGGGKTKV